jgi:hypothetical protein
MVCLIPAYGKVYLIQPYVIMFVNELQQFSGIFPGTLIFPPIKLTATIYRIPTVMKVKTFKTYIIVFIGNDIMFLTLH